MMIRSIVVPAMMFAAGCTGLGDDTSARDSQADGQAAELSGASSSGAFQCLNKTSLQVGCIGQIGVLPININVSQVSVLTNNQLLILSNDLNNLSIFDVGVLNGDEILNDVKATALSDFLNEFKVIITDNVVNVCTVLVGIQFCK
jgi:hypothetical protein